MSEASILWYDFETFGINPKQDSPAQVAMIRTDLQLNIIADPINIFCKPSKLMIPSAQACLITGISPQIAASKGVEEHEFTRLIHQQMMQPNTCVAGYNSIRFDDEVSRFLFYRNLFDPYAREYKFSNSRWDILDVTRTCYALCPEGIEWPKKDGVVSFKLDTLCPANNIFHENAHDAVSDVQATIEFAQLLRDKQPKLFNYMFNNRGKQQVAKLVQPQKLTPFVHVSGMISPKQGCLTVMIPLFTPPLNHNEIICWDLTKSPALLHGLTTEQIIERLYKKTQDMQEGEQRLGLKGISLNKCPVVAPRSVLTPARAERLGLDLEKIELHYQQIDIVALRQQLMPVYQQKLVYGQLEAAQALYDGFISNMDRKKLERCLSMSAAELANLPFKFESSRLHELLLLYRCKYYEDSLNEKDQAFWLEYQQQNKQRSDIGASLSLSAAQTEVDQLLLDHPKHPILLQVVKYLQTQFSQL